MWRFFQETSNRCRSRRGTAGPPRDRNQAVDGSRPVSRAGRHGSPARVRPAIRQPGAGHGTHARGCGGNGGFARLWQDIRYAARVLRREPAFTVAAVLSLALGIGATTAVFSIADTIFLRPLPYADAGRLVWVAHPRLRPRIPAFAGLRGLAPRQPRIPGSRRHTGQPQHHHAAGRVRPRRGARRPRFGQLPGYVCRHARSWAARSARKKNFPTDPKRPC